MKRIIAILLILAFAFPLAACSQTVAPAEPEPTIAPAPTASPTPKPTAAPTIAPAVTETDGEKHILINQVGYRPSDTKVAFIRGSAVGAKFIVANSKNEVVYEGSINESIFDPAADETVYHGDFSALTEEGEYTIIVEGLGSSDTFSVSQSPYAPIAQEAISMLNSARCGCDLPAHAACHTTYATGFDTDVLADVSGGWHTAADYNRASVPTAKALADLLLTYIYSSTPSDALTDEIIYGLEWLMKMQSPEGGVYRMVCSETPVLDRSPESDDSSLTLLPVSTAATADFAAVAALASCTLDDYYALFPHDLLAAAKKAYEYLAVTEYSEAENLPSIGGETYLDTNDSDERLFAAVALYYATGEERYHNDAKKLLFDGSIDFTGFKLHSMSGYAHLLYLKLDETKLDAAVAEAVKQGVVTAADKLMAAIDASGYNIALGMDFSGESNMRVLSDAMLLLLASDITGSKAYASNAKFQLDYILGANATGYCFVTGFGTVAPKNVHSALSMLNGKCEPGMLVSGPCDAKGSSTKPAKLYEDDSANAAQNGVAVYYNSALIYVAEHFN